MFFLAMTQGWSNISAAFILWEGSILRHLKMKSLHQVEISLIEPTQDQIRLSSISTDLPLSMTMRVMPSAQISAIWVVTLMLAELSKFSFLASGGRQALVPLLELTSISSVPRPKSAILASSFSESKMFSGLMSRCAILTTLCMQSTARLICLKYLLHSDYSSRRYSKLPLVLMSTSVLTWLIKPPGQYSRIRNILFFTSSSITSYNLMM